MIYSKKLSQFNEIIHGFTTRQDGNFRLVGRGQNLPIGKFCPSFGRLVLMKQAHQDKIKLVKFFGEGKDIMVLLDGFDGLITQEKTVALGVMVADCLPILFYEPVKKIIGAVHAGWRGTLMSISQKMVGKIENLGGKAKNIIAAFGPHIGRCCYDIERKRACLFEVKFGKDQRVISNFEGKLHLDLGFVNFLQLVRVGVKKENIDALPFCTFCNKEKFFSFRRAKLLGDDFGEMLSFISLKPPVSYTNL